MQLRAEGCKLGHHPRDTTIPSNITRALFIGSSQPLFCYLPIMGLESPRLRPDMDSYSAVCRALLFDLDSEIFI